MNRYLLCLATLLGACKPRPQAASEVLGAAEQSYQESIHDFLQDRSVAEGWEWFMHRSHGFRGFAMVLVKMLPELDPEIWGTPLKTL